MMHIGDMPVLGSLGYGQVSSSEWTVLAGAGLAVFLMLAALILHTHSSLEEHTARADERISAINAARRWHAVVGVATVAVILLSAFHLVVPPTFEVLRSVSPSRAAQGAAVNGSIRTGLFCVTVTAAMAAPAVWAIATRLGNRGLIDGGWALFSLGICGLTAWAVPSYPVPATERYPILLNALVVGFALATWLCGLTAVRTLPPRDGVRGGLAVALSGAAGRFVFLNGVLGLLAGGLMAIWPRLRSVTIPDETIGRVTAGFGAHLFLLLVLLWSARRLKVIPLHVLSVVAVISSAGFMMTRAYPYTPRF